MSSRGDRLYFCHGCQRELKDFSKNDDLSELKTMLDSGQQVCGIFNRSQINRNFLKYAFSAIIITAISGCDDQNPQPETRGELSTLTVPVMGQVMDIAGDVEIVDFLDPILYPTPVGGYERFYQNIKEKLSFPTTLQVGGKVFVELVIDTQGNVIRCRSLKGISPEVDSLVSNELIDMNLKFYPGQSNGAPVEMAVVLPIVFNR